MQGSRVHLNQSLHVVAKWYLEQKDKEQIVLTKKRSITLAEVHSQVIAHVMLFFVWNIMTGMGAIAQTIK